MMSFKCNKRNASYESHQHDGSPKLLKDLAFQKKVPVLTCFTKEYDSKNKKLHIGISLGI